MLFDPEARIDSIHFSAPYVGRFFYGLSPLMSPLMALVTMPFGLGAMQLALARPLLCC